MSWNTDINKRADLITESYGTHPDGELILGHLFGICLQEWTPVGYSCPDIEP